MNNFNSIYKQIDSVISILLETIAELHKSEKKVIFSNPTYNKEEKLTMTTRKDGRLMARVYIAPNKYKYIYGHTRAEIDYKVRCAKAEISQQKRKTILNGDMSLREYITYYFEKISTIKESSRNVYRSKIELIKNSSVSNKKIKDLDLEDFNAILNDCETSSAKEVVINILKTSFETIKNIGIIPYNYTVLLKNELSEEEKIERSSKELCHKYMPIEDFELLLNNTRNSQQRMAFTILYYTGIRIGELLALTYDDFENDFRYLKVTKQFSENCGAMTTTKSRQSIRRIKLQPTLRNAIIEYKRNGKVFDFCSTRFKWQLKTTLYAFKRNFNKAYNFHDFRHSFATNSFIAEKNAKVVQSELGHKSYELTINTYTHVPELEDSSRAKVKLLFAE